MTSYMKPVADFHRTRVLDYRYVLENTMQPFAPGDIFLGRTLLNDPGDDHAGLGRMATVADHARRRRRQLAGLDLRQAFHVPLSRRGPAAA
jgi:hypothetical protein